MAEMTRFRIGITHDFLRPDGTLSFPDIGLDTLADSERIGVEWEFIPESVDEITPDIAARYDGIVALRPRFTAATVGRVDRRLAAIARFGVGYDRIDVPAMTAAGVLLAITPDGVRRPVAQAVLTFILALAGRLFDKDRVTRAGDGFTRAGEFMGMGITGRTLALLGVGNIGRDIVKLVAPFEMRVIAHDPYARADDLASIGVKLVDIDTLFREGDFVSVNCPLTDETRHIVGERLLGLMKPSAYLINTARGPIVDETALYPVLRDRRIAGAGLDVFEMEPVAADNPILQLDNVIVTPHALCWTDECFRGNGAGALGALLAIARGEAPANGVVNRAALDHPWLKAHLGAFAERARANEEAARATA
ncbi:MAG: dehydrogenase [Chloroflexota bacterium]|nr:MAG: dehydrogenase [Chloroflexota bacterium]